MSEENLFALLQGHDGSALTYAGTDIDYGSLRTTAVALARRLRGAGLRQGDVVSVLLPNSPGFVVTYLACWYSGLVANPLNARQSAAELTTVVRHAGSRLLVTGPTHAEAARACAAAAAVETLELHDEALRTPVTGGSDVAPPAPGGSRPAVLIYTSGTTSAPKGVLLSHANLLADARGLAERLGTDSGYRTTCFMPLFHCNALIFSHLTTFVVGGNVQLLPKFSASTLWDDVTTHGSHSFSCPPTVLAILLERAQDAWTRPAAMRFVKVGAAPLAESLATRFEERFGLPLVEGYGMTEGTATTVMHDPRTTRRPDTVGFTLPGQRVRIVDEHDRELPVGQVGEIQIGGDTVMLGYHRDPDLTAATVVDGWLRTGDLGVLDPDGHLRLCGRRKELIIRGGENIFPSALDQVLESHPQVSEGAAYGIPDAIWGESPAVAVVPRNGNVDLEHLRAFVTDRVADFAAPVAYRVVASIPRNAVGKVRRHELAQAHFDQPAQCTHPGEDAS